MNTLARNSILLLFATGTSACSVTRPPQDNYEIHLDGVSEEKLIAELADALDGTVRSYPIEDGNTVGNKLTHVSGANVVLAIRPLSDQRCDPYSNMQLTYKQRAYRLDFVYKVDKDKVANERSKMFNVIKGLHIGVQEFKEC